MTLPWWEHVPQKQIYQWSVLHSTHQEGFSWVENHEIKDTTWIWLKAHRQTQGVGQFSRPFLSPLGGIYSTLICRWPTNEFFPLLPLVVGLAIIDVLPVSCQLKWVNDIYKEDQKLGGVLITRLINQEKVVYVISFGLNINSLFSSNMDCGSFSSIKQYLGYGIDLERLWDQIEECLYRRLKMVLSEDKTVLIQDLNQCLMYKGEQVYVRTPHGWFEGVFHGISPSGRFLLEDQEIETVLSIGKIPSDMSY